MLLPVEATRLYLDLRPFMNLAPLAVRYWKHLTAQPIVGYLHLSVRDPPLPLLPRVQLAVKLNLFQLECTCTVDAAAGDDDDDANAAPSCFQYNAI